MSYCSVVGCFAWIEFVMFKPIRQSALIHHSKLNIFAIAHPWRSRNQFVIWSMCDGSRARTHTCTLSATIYSAIGVFFIIAIENSNNYREKFKCLTKIGIRFFLFGLKECSLLLLHKCNTFKYQEESN